MKAKVIKFKGNPKPAVRHDDVALILILPVIRIEGISSPSRRGRRKRQRGGDHGK